jgi:hypothetical protein
MFFKLADKACRLSADSSHPLPAARFPLPLPFAFCTLPFALP